ncbi:helix-turn-helix domain-containing protein, partial [Serratia marcescens]|uniref:helix-turn-helix domain-containing protein n=1 Tax=Serratia marcescens TaxID=615 RepID=UPI00281539E4
LNPYAPREAAPVAPAPEGAGALPALPLDLKNWQLEQEKVLIEAALQQGRFNQRKAAQLLGLTYHQLRGMLKKHALLQNGEADDE